MSSLHPFDSHPNDPGAVALALGIIGQSARMRDVLWQIEKAGATRAGVIITGEGGTGRGLVARAIHACNGTEEMPFVAVYCDRQDAGDLEHALFGSASSGTSTGSASSRTGASARASARPDATSRVTGGDVTGGNTVEHIAAGSLLHKARGGTIYFRHIEEMSERTQARLSHYFRDREAVIEGSTEAERGAQSFDVRPMLAADTDFPARIAEGLVRQDLYRRFANVCIDLPPLRERPEDIPALAAHLVGRACDAAGRPVKVLTDAALTVLSALPWKGNVRELQSVLTALVGKVDTTEITLADVLVQLHLESPVERSPSVAQSGETLRAARERFERDYVAAVLARCRGRVPDAAKALGIQRANLYRKMRSLHVPRRKNPASGNMS